MREETMDKEKKSLSACVSARALQAMTPMIRSVQDFAASEYAFMRQLPTESFGVYLLPADKGVLVAAVDAYRVLVVRDVDGHATEPLKVYFPDELLDSAQVKTVTLSNENGSPLEIQMLPKPAYVACFEGFAIVAADDSEKWGGTFGSWSNRDHGNVIDGASYRAKPADLKRIARMLRSAATGKYEATDHVDLNLPQLAPFCHAAEVLGLQTSLRFCGSAAPVEIFSTDDERMFGLLMPAASAGLNPIEHETRAALLAAAKGETS